jgi:hypothetical protein
MLDLDWIELAQDEVHLRDLVDTYMNLRPSVSVRVEKF